MVVNLQVNMKGWLEVRKKVIWILLIAISVSFGISANGYGKSNNYHPIIVNGMFIGGYGNGKWLDSNDLYKRLSSKERFKIYSREKFLGEAAGIKQGDNADEMIGLDSISCKEDDYFAIQCGWNPLPRLPKSLNVNNESYRKIIRGILDENNIKKSIPVRIKQIMKFDIEGDGIDEVIIAAENISPLKAYSHNQDYSLLILRKIVNGKVRNIIMKKDIVITNKEYEELTPLTYQAKYVMDADGDGHMEMIVEMQYYEGISYGLYKMIDGKTECLLLNTIGA